MSQSQTSFLEDVVSWSRTQCQENWSHTLPRLINCFCETQLLQEQVSVLKIICQLFLPCVEAIDAEEKVFCYIVSQSCEIFDKILADICQHIKSDCWNPKEKDADVSLFLGLLQDIINCCEVCVMHVYQEDLTLEWSQVHSLPHGTVHLLKGAYGHCKMWSNGLIARAFCKDGHIHDLYKVDSGELYGNHMPVVSEPLSALFKKAHSLQLAFLKLFDKIHIGIPPTENDVQDLCLVCHGLFEVCQIVTSLDMKLVVTLWKAISRHVVHNKDHLCDRLEVASMVRYLCGEIKTGYTYLFQLLPYLNDDGMAMSQGDEKGFQKSVRILGFQMKIVVMFIREFADFLHDCEQQVYNLLIHLYRYVPPSLQARKMQQKHITDIEQQLLNASSLVVTSLLSNRKFVEHISGSDTIQKLTNEDCFPHLLLVLMALDSLPKAPAEVASRWISPVLHTEDKSRFSIIQTAFVVLEKCYVEVRLPIYLSSPMCSGKPQKDVSLYEKVCIHLCGFIGSLPAAHFSTLEKILLDNLLSCDVIRSGLAADVWCFLARYGTADLCSKHVNFMMQLIQTTDGFSIQHTNIISLLKRLLKSLAQEHQMDLLKSFPVRSNFTTWSQLSTSCLPSSAAKDMTEALVSHSVKILDEFVSSKEKWQQNFVDLNSCLTCLKNLMGNTESVLRNISASAQSNILRKTCQLWASISVADWIGTPLMELSLGKLIQHTAYIATMLNSGELLKVFNVILSAIQMKPSQYLKLSVVQFLGRFGKVKIPGNFEQPSTLNKLSESFTNLLSDGDVVVHHKSVEAFTRFAEETMHESVVPECIKTDQRLQDQVVMYLNKCAYQVGSGQSRLEYLQKEMKNKTSRNVPESSMITRLEPSCKRQRLDTGLQSTDKTLNTEIRDLITTMKMCVNHLEELPKDGDSRLPQDMKENLNKVYHQIANIIKENG